MNRVFSLLVLFFVIFCGCSQDKCDYRDFPSFRVKKASLYDILKTTGIVESQVGGEIKVGSRISGTVERLFVKVGDYVEKGELIAIIEHKDLQAKVNELEGEKELLFHALNTVKREYPLKIEAQKKHIFSIRSKLDYLKKELERYRKLYEKKMISYMDYERKRSEYKSLKDELEAERSKLSLLETEFKNRLKDYLIKLKTIEEKIKIAKINLSYAFIKAPISGVVSSISTQEGETVAASLNAPVFVNIVNLKKLQISAFVDEIDIGRVKRGQKVKFYVEGYPDVKFTGKVVKIYPKAFVKDNVVTFKVEISIDESEHLKILKPNMTAYIDIIVGERKDVLCVPVKFVKLINGKNCVFLKEGSNIVKTQVKVGIVYNSMIEILSGLKENDEVVLPDRRYVERCL